MIHLNIIPDSLKKEIRLSTINTRLKNVYQITFSLSCLYAVMMLFMYLAINFHFIETVNETTQLTKSSQNNINDVKEINDLLKYVNNIQNDSVKWSYLLNILKTSAAVDINYSKIAINKKDNSIALAGISKTRDSLLSLKSSLESTDYLAEIEFPIKNLLEKTDINFEIKATFKNYEFE